MKVNRPIDFIAIFLIIYQNYLILEAIEKSKSFLNSGPTSP